MSKSTNKIICMIAQASYPGDPRIRRQAEALEKAGFEVDILCRPSGAQKKVEKFSKVTAYRIINAPRQDSIVKWIYYSSLFFMMAFIKIQFLHVKRKYRVIQIHNMPDHLIFSAIVQKLLGVQLVIDIHDLTVEMFQEKWQGKKKSFIS
ncbi:MAG: glycosyltransferase, partial [Ignavibacteria bacterium]